MGFRAQRVSVVLRRASIGIKLGCRIPDTQTYGRFLNSSGLRLYHSFISCIGVLAFRADWRTQARTRYVRVEEFANNRQQVVERQQQASAPRHGDSFLSRCERGL